MRIPTAAIAKIPTASDLIERDILGQKPSIALINREASRADQLRRDAFAHNPAKYERFPRIKNKDSRA